MPKKLLFLIFFIILVFAVLYSRAIFPQSKNPSLVINGQKINLEIADTDKKRTQGLSNRKSLSADSGMLFLFPQKGIYSFWMKNMHFPIDIIWIDDDTIIGFLENLPPEGTNPQNIYTPPQLINTVLEVNSGMVKSLNIKIGDRVEFRDIN